MTIKEIYKTMEFGPAPESATLAMDWIHNKKSKFQLFIDGKWQTPTAKKYFDTVNPATKEQLAKISDAKPKGENLILPL